MLGTWAVLCCTLAGPPQPGVASWLRTLAESKAPAARAEAAECLGEVGPPGEGFADESEPLVAGLIQAVEGDEDGYVRRKALDALRGTARLTPRVLRAWARALCDPDKDIRFGTAKMLEGRGAAVLPALRFALEGKTPSAEAAELAGGLGKAAKPLVPALTKLLRHESRPLRYYAALALLEIDPEGSAEKADAAMASALADSFAMMEEGDPLVCPVRMPAPVPRTARLLGERLETDNGSDSTVIAYLEEFGRFARPAAGGLESALRKGALITQLKAATVLVRCGRTAKAVPWLVSVLETKVYDGSPIPSCAYWGLSFAGEAARGTVPLLLRKMRDAKGEDRAWAAWCLHVLDLEVEFEGKQLLTREAALDALVRLMKDADEETSGVATMRLCLVAGPKAARAVPALVQRMDDSPDHREHILHALGWIGPTAKEAGPAIRKRISDENASVVEAAARALVRVEPDAPGTLKALLALRERDHPYVTAGALASLGELGPRAKVAVPWVMRQLRSRNRYVGSEAADALWKIDPATARKVGAW